MKLMKKTTFTTALLGAAACASIASAQSRQIPAPPQAEPIVIHSATIHPMSSDAISNGYIRFEGGKITAVGSGEPAAAVRRGARLVDASGLHVFPGIISPKSQVGLSETGAVGVTLDYNEYGNVKPEVFAAVAVNPDTDLIPVARDSGILTFCAFPTGGLICGHASIMRGDGWTWETMAIKTHAGLVLSWPRTEPINSRWMRTSPEQQRREIAENLREVEEFFDEADAYLEAVDNDDSVKTDLRFEGMRDVLEGREPLFVLAASSGQIESAVAWSVRREYKIVIVGGDEADQVTPLLAKHDIPVIVDGMHRLPGRRHYDPKQPFTVPLALHEAGVRFCIGSGAEPAHERNLGHNAATAAAYGLPVIEAQRAVTQYAADILGIGETHGTLEKGKQATLIITSGDPLEIMTDTLIAYIDGRQIDMGSRHKSLYAKYREKYRQLGLLDE